MPITPFGWHDFKLPGVSAENLEAMHAAAGQYVDGLRVATAYLVPSGGDDSAAFAAAVAAGGTIVLAPGTFHFDTVTTSPSVATVTKNTSVRVLGAGRGVTICQFGGSVQQLLGFHYTADYDSFSQIHISDFTVDAQNIAATHNTGAILGTGIGGGSAQRINIDQVDIRRVDAINVPYGTGVNGGVFLSVIHPAVGETQTNITNVRVDDVRVFGGSFGTIIQGLGTASGGPGTSGINVWMDHIHISNWYHDTLTTPTGAVSIGANCMIGGYGYGGSDIVIENGYGKNSPDVGIETDALQTVQCRNVLIEECWHGSYYHTNYRDPSYPNSQRVVYENCRAQRFNVTNPFPAFATANHATSTPIGTVVYENCSYYSNKTAVMGTIGEAIGSQSSGLLVLGAIEVNGFQSTMEDMSDAGSGSTDCISLYFALATSPTVRPTLTINDFKANIYGAMTGSGSDYVVGMRIEGAMFLKIDGADFDFTWTAPNGGAKGMDIGRATSTLGGAIKRMRFRRVPASPPPVGISVRSTATLTISGMLSIEDYDGSACPSNSAMYGIDVTQVAKVIAVRWRGPTYPQASAVMGTSNFAAATFTTATGNQYLGPQPAEIQFANTTGSGITAIAASKDGTTYENVYEQTSGAMAQDVLCPVDPGDYIKVTFTTTQPTTRIRFRRI